MGLLMQIMYLILSTVCLGCGGLIIVHRYGIRIKQLEALDEALAAPRSLGHRRLLNYLVLDIRLAVLAQDGSLRKALQELLAGSRDCLGLQHYLISLTWFL